MLAIAVISPKDQAKMLDSKFNVFSILNFYLSLVLGIKTAGELGDAIAQQRQKDLLEKLKGIYLRLTKSRTPFLDINTVSPIVHFPCETQ